MSKTGTYTASITIDIQIEYGINSKGFTEVTKIGLPNIEERDLMYFLEVNLDEYEFDTLINEMLDLENKTHSSSGE